ncbi:MAG: LD-carboxypeptidase [Calditrichota bacterium]
MYDPKLPALLPGGKVGLVAPAGAVKPEQVQESLRLLDNLGIIAVPGKHAFANNGIVSAPHEHRLDDIHSFLRDDHISAIWALRGGYGSMQLLRDLDYHLLAEKPRWIIGFSDLTAFQWALFNKLKLPTLSGFTLTSQLHSGNPWLHTGLQMLAGERRKLTAADVAATSIEEVIPGRARGTILGGTLTMIAALCGTPYFNQRRNLILLLEDVNEPLYRLDRIIQQLDMMGFWKKVRGIILGRFIYGAGELDILPSLLPRLQAGTPVVSGFPYGHYADSCPMPLGVRAEFETRPFFLRWRSPVNR